MKLLAIDVGKGTEDVFYWDSSQGVSFENAIQLILPSSASEMSFKLRRAARTNNEIYIRGEIMGGEPWHKTLYELVEDGLSIYATPNAAMSLRYDLSLVKKRGVKITSEEFIVKRTRKNPHAEIQTSDVNWDRLEQLFHSMDISFSEIDAVLVCAQDHGLPPSPETSVKEFRTKMHAEIIRETKTMSALLFDSNSIPKEFPRLTSNLEGIRRRFGNNVSTYVMDSSLAVLSGAFLDPTVSVSDWNLIINFGNGHTIVGMFSPGGRIAGILETHTHLIRKNLGLFRSQLKNFLDQEMQNERILESGGHGCVYFEEFFPPQTIWIIGPNRSLAKNLGFEYSFAHPIGNMMMSGPLGMLRLAFPEYFGSPE